MQAEVINTGSELLLGLVTNTHLAYLAGELTPCGVSIARQVCVPDGPPIRQALETALQRADLVLTTGGLGPTSDDLTREAAAELLGLPLIPDEEILSGIRERFARRGLPLADRIARQAMVPAGTAVLPNPQGTAPGLYFPPRCWADTARAIFSCCPDLRANCGPCLPITSCPNYVPSCPLHLCANAASTV
jgi:Predicted nucleotide-utilizing enzyme related to molybdopterin-biosynthesis enzyme MoeA